MQGVGAGDHALCTEVSEGRGAAVVVRAQQVWVGQRRAEHVSPFAGTDPRGASQDGGSGQERAHPSRGEPLGGLQGLALVSTSLQYETGARTPEQGEWLELERLHVGSKLLPEHKGGTAQRTRR